MSAFRRPFTKILERTFGRGGGRAVLCKAGVAEQQQGGQTLAAAEYPWQKSAGHTAEQQNVTAQVRGRPAAQRRCDNRQQQARRHVPVRLSPLNCKLGRSGELGTHFPQLGRSVKQAVHVPHLVQLLGVQDVGAPPRELVLDRVVLAVHLWCRRVFV